MAKFVSIDNNPGSYRPGLNEIGDIIEIVDDNVELSGAGYLNHKITHISGITAAQIKIKQKENWPKRRIRDFERYWLNPDDSLWYKIQNLPKYRFSLKDLSQQDLTKIRQDGISTEEKLAILGKIHTKFVILEDNHTTREYYLWDTGELD